MGYAWGPGNNHGTTNTNSPGPHLALQGKHSTARLREARRDVASVGSDLRDSQEDNVEKDLVYHDDKLLLYSLAYYTNILPTPSPSVRCQSRL